MSDLYKKELNEGKEIDVLPLTINNNRFEWKLEYITGLEIRKLGNIPNDHEIFLSIKKPWEDEPIFDDTKVNLARPEIEHFYSKDKHSKIVIIVNGREKPWTEKVISFEQVVMTLIQIRSIRLLMIKDRMKILKAPWLRGVVLLLKIK